MSRRTDRVADLLRQALAETILRRVRDPRVRLANVTSVDVSPDLKKAVVQVSVMLPEGEQEACVAALQHARGFIRTQLAHRLKNIRTLPDLTFTLDRRSEYSQRIETLLEELNTDDDSPHS